MIGVLNPPASLSDILLELAEQLLSYVQWNYYEPLRLIIAVNFLVVVSILYTGLTWLRSLLLIL